MIERSWLCLTLAVLTCASALPGSAAGKDGEVVFGTAKVISLHLQFDARELAKMQPAQGGFGPPGFGPAKEPAPGTHRNTFGVEFPWARGELTHDGKKLADVGLRYKGNFTFMASPGL